MSKEIKFVGFHNIEVYQTVKNETYIGGINSDGENITLVFSTIDLLEWLDITHMKKEAIKHIKQLNK
tara:strand:+ start:264 stop:464 length:201 start_codon:yes stop_codon:yes gene_type:complete